MSISQAFSEAVRNNNIIMVRIMLKDSLIYDRSFAKFSEMRDYAERHGVDFWDKSANRLIRDEKPWNEKMLDREMTSLISHFTQERVLYVKELIREIYRLNARADVLQGQKARQTIATNDRLKTEALKKHLPSQDAMDSSMLLFKCVIEMNNVILQDNLKSAHGKLSKDNLQKMKNAAEEIVCLCNRLFLEEA